MFRPFSDVRTTAENLEQARSSAVLFDSNAAELPPRKILGWIHPTDDAFSG